MVARASAFGSNALPSPAAQPGSGLKNKQKSESLVPMLFSCLFFLTRRPTHNVLNRVPGLSSMATKSSRPGREKRLFYVVSTEADCISGSQQVTLMALHLLSSARKSASIIEHSDYGLARPGGPSQHIPHDYA